MIRYILMILTVFFLIISQSTLSVAVESKVQVKVDGINYVLNVSDIPGFENYLAELPPSRQKVEKDRLRGWVPSNSKQDTLIIGYSCGVRLCKLNVLKKKPGTEKWEGIPLEDSATYQESTLSPDEKTLAVVTSQQVEPGKTTNTIYPLKIEPTAPKMLKKISNATPKDIFNGSYTRPFYNFKFEDNENFHVHPLLQEPPPPNQISIPTIIKGKIFR
ncbi:hypothetical protein BLGI_4445 [Brevibacillus laterosporus GI-9]|uniref:hypothetical protein n=1 Tax=Brevibacillus laterosporus TaxID=1465 RepID=UPI0002405406|nr:hypothetical protein [Brevibacillus laterosporus]CCF16476.1 hypothetical protein BLGI_4445 [Brevibacillus laterosporus GI-9]